MKRQMWVVAFVVVALTGATLAAQTSGSSSSRDQTQSGTVTLTGCLQKGSQSGTAGTTGTGATTGAGTSSSSSSASAQFILANAQMGSGSSSSRSSTSGTSTSGTAGTSSASSGSRYILDGQESELSKHVGEKVEIMGTLEPRSGSGASGTSSSSTSGTSGTSTSGSSSSGQHVRVQSVTTVASSCSQ